MLGIPHSGRFSTGALNFKANYPSFMNYLYQNEALGLSHGTAPALNPTRLDEALGIGPAGAPILNKLRSEMCPGGLCVNVSTGAVDWNRDGVILPPGSPPVRGAVLPWGAPTMQRPSTFVNQLGDATLSWVGGAGNATGSVEDRLYMVGRSQNFALQYAWVARTALDLGCGGAIPVTTLRDDPDTSKPETPCASFSAPADVPGATELTVAPGAAEVAPATLMVVWQGNTGTLQSKLLFSSTSVTLPGAVTALGDVTAVSTAPGVVKVWAPAGINPVRLKQWTYQNGAWTGPVDQQWTDGTLVSTAYGIGATVGFQDGSATASLYAAIVDNDVGGTILFARQEASGVNAGRWTKLTATWDSQPPPFGNSRPGLAYQRTGQPNSVGRFYMAFNQRTCTGNYSLNWVLKPEECEPMLLMTEGNMTAGTPRLQWLKPLRFDAAGAIGGITLVQDLTRDLNLRAATTRLGPMQSRLGKFLPFADGIFNTELTDHDDFALLTGALRASLGLDNGGVWPGGVLPPSLQ